MTNEQLNTVMRSDYIQSERLIPQQNDTASVCLKKIQLVVVNGSLIV